MYGGSAGIRKMAPPPAAHSAGHATANEIQAKEKLIHYVYEYLIHNNATKTADMFKSELMSNMPTASINVADAPGFLTQWFALFWDIYSGDPERRDKCNPSQESKAFHDYGFVTGAGMRPQFGPSGMMPPGGPQGMPPEMNPYFRASMPGPGGFAPRPPGAHFMGPPQHGMIPPNAAQLRNPGAIPDPRMRMPNSMPFPMRPPNRYGPPYMESPSGNPGFPILNGGPPQAMPPPHDLVHDARYAAMMPPTSAGMPPQFMPQDPSQMHPPSSMTPSTSVPNTNGQMPPTSSGVGSSLPPLQANSQLSSLINGDDHKQSPHHPLGGPNNGTPGSMAPNSHHGAAMMGAAGPGPGSAAAVPPGSVHTPGQPGSAVNPATSQQPQQQMQPPPMNMPPPGQQPPGGMIDHHDMMDFTPNNASRPEDINEIKKIREGLLDDFDQA